MRDVLVIAGSGETAFNNDQINKLVEGISKIGATQVSLVGDGEKDISIGQIREELSRLSGSENEITIFIQMHGEIKNEQFHFMTSNNNSISSKELFEIIREELDNKRVDVFVTSCHSGACLQDKDILAEGSAIATLSQRHETTAGSEVKKLINNLDSISDDITAFNLLKLYCSKILTNRIPPEFAIAGTDRTIQLDELLKASLGQKINNQRVQSNLNSYIETEELERLIERMQNAKNEYEFGAVDYGQALAVCVTSKFGNNITNKNYIPFTGHSELSLDDSMNLFRTIDSEVPAASRNNAKRNLIKILHELPKSAIGKEEL